MIVPQPETLIKESFKRLVMPMESGAIYLLRILIVYYLNLCMVGIVGLLR